MANPIVVRQSPRGVNEPRTSAPPNLGYAAVALASTEYEPTDSAGNAVGCGYYCTTAGNLVCDGLLAGSNFTIALAVGQWCPILVTKVYASSTSAGLLVS